jgi:hypothetical protein
LVMPRVLEPCSIGAPIFVARVAMRDVVIMKPNTVALFFEVRLYGYAAVFVVPKLCIACCEEVCVGLVDEVLMYIRGRCPCCG